MSSLRKTALTPAQREELRIQSLPKVSVQVDAACVILDVSRPTFDRYIKPELRCIRQGNLRLYLVRELQEWAETNAARTFEDTDAARRPAA